MLTKKTSINCFNLHLDFVSCFYFFKSQASHILSTTYILLRKLLRLLEVSTRLIKSRRATSQLLYLLSTFDSGDYRFFREINRARVVHQTKIMKN